MTIFDAARTEVAGTMTRAIEILAAGAMALLFVSGAGVVTPDSWYSPDPNYRLQTDAFLRGELALQPYLFHHRIDWILGRGGMHQAWGLGVPLLRLPFEAAAGAVGAVGFPDRLVFVLAHAAVALLLLRALRRSGSRRDTWDDLLLRIGLVAMALLSPSFLALAHVRFHVYEEAVAYGILAAFMVLALLLNFQARPTARRWFVLALAAGLVPLVRPTTALYGGLTFALALVLAVRARLGTRSIVAGALLFAAGPVAVLIGNQIRFGSLLEFGYSLSFSGTAVDILSLRFGYPYQHVDLRTAFDELFRWLFLAERHTRIEWLTVPWSPYRSDILRFRESYFPTFDIAVFASVVGAWSLCLFEAARRQSRAPRVASRSLLLAAWSASTFALLFAFYLRAPTLTSRYTMDFLPALAAGVIGGVLAARDLMARWPRMVATASAGVAAFAAIWIPVAAAAAFAREGRAYQIYERTASWSSVAAQRAQHEERRRLQLLPDLPEVYTCPGPQPTPALPYNLVGWERAGSCRADLVTQAFFERTPCISARVTAQDPAVLETVTAKVNYDFLRRAAIQREGDGHRIFFCRPLDTLQVDSPVQAFSIRWATITPTVPEIPELRLHEIRREASAPDRTTLRGERSTGGGFREPPG